ncbi:MAG: hypothetical protein K0Q76_4298, partial [Panacagrimonas sp.]
ALTDERFVRDARFAEPGAVRVATPQQATQSGWRRVVSRLFDGVWPQAQARPAPADTGATPSAGERVARRFAGLEIVAVRDTDALRVWVDDESSNAPRTGLDLRLRTTTHLMRAVEEGAGRYRIPVDPALAPGAPATLELRATDGGTQHLEFALPAAGF